MTQVVEENVKLDDLAIGVDAGGTKILVAAVNPATGKLVGQPIVIQPMAKTPGGTFEQDYEAILNAVRLLVQQHSAPEARVTIGLGIAGKLLDARTGMYNCPNLGEKWNGIEFVPRLAKDLGLPVALGNDAEAGATAAGLFDEHVKHEDSFGFGIWGTGIGYCLVIRTKEGYLLFFPTESGHQKIWRFAFRMCGCGRRGCVEAYYGGGALCKRNRVQSAKELARWKWIFVTLGMARWASNMASTFPVKTVFSGGIATQQPTVMKLINSYVQLVVKVVRPGDIAVSGLGANAGVVGAALLPRVLDTRTHADITQPTDN